MLGILAGLILAFFVVSAFAEIIGSRLDRPD